MSAEDSKINLYRLIPRLTDAFARLDIAAINDHVARLLLVHGDGPEIWHARDRFVLVLDGECALTLQDGTARLVEGHGYRIPAGKGHRFAARRKALLLVVEPNDNPPLPANGAEDP